MPSQIVPRLPCTATPETVCSATCSPSQITWSPNITTRLLLYVAETYRRMVQKRRHALYGSRLIELPAPEFYIVYTGSKGVPDVASFCDDVLKGASNSGLELKAKVITDSKGVIGEYVEFCEVFQEVMALDISPEEKGMAEGREEGLEEGLAEGRAEGRTESLIASVKAITSNMNVGPKKAMELLDIPAEEQENLLKLI